MNQVTKLAYIKNVIGVLVRMQHEMNCKVDPVWWERKFQFHRAVWTELGEGMDYLAWEWWKYVGQDVWFKGNAKANKGHYFLEVVDALHFTLSMLINEELTTGVKPEHAHYVLPNVADNVAKYLNDPISGSYGCLFGSDVPGASLPELTESAALCALYRLPKNVISYLVMIACKMGMGLHGLSAFYVGKNVLNKFRQDNGYKDGTYVKTWFDDEDNGYLAELLFEYTYGRSEEQVYADVVMGDLEKFIVSKLGEAYAKVITPKVVDETTASS